MKLTEHALSAAPLLQAIAAGGDLSNAALAAATGRRVTNMSRDLMRLAEAGWIEREDDGGRVRPAAGKPPTLTAEGLAIVAAIARAEGDVAAPADAAAVELPLHLIDENPDNPRQAACDEDDAELTESIGRKGVLQPIMVRPSLEPGRYVVVMGSRRRRCSLAAGKLTIPAVIRDLDATEAFEVATIENLQRADMSPLDEARAFRRILDGRLAVDPDLKLKEAKEVIAQATGKSVRYVELRLQLLTLPAVLQAEVESGKTTPKDAILRQRQMPKLDGKITPRQWLTMVEVLDKAEREPLPTSYEWEIPDTYCRVDAAVQIAADAEVAKVVGSPTYMIDEPGDVWANHERTGFVKVGVHSSTLVQLRLLAKDRLGVEDPDLRGDAELRTRLLDRLREEVLGEGVPADGSYITTWLNGPFEPSAQRLAKLAADRAAEQAEREAREQARCEVEERRQAEQAIADRDWGDEGRAKLAAVRAFEDDAPGLSQGDFAQRFAALIAEVGFPARSRCATTRGRAAAKTPRSTTPTARSSPARAMRWRRSAGSTRSPSTTPPASRPSAVRSWPSPTT